MFLRTQNHKKKTKCFKLDQTKTMTAFDGEESYNQEWDIRKCRAGGRREGFAKHSVKWSRQRFEDQRQKPTVAKYGERDDSMLNTVQYSLSKHKRWEEIEQLKKEWNVKVCELRRRLPRKRAPFRKLKPAIVSQLGKLQLLVVCADLLARKYEPVKPKETRKTRVVKGRSGRVWKKTRNTRKNVTPPCLSSCFRFAYLFGTETVYVVLQARDSHQYNHLASLKSPLESKLERNKKRSSKKSEKRRFLEAMTSYKL